MLALGSSTTMIGEGSGVLLLEELEHAKMRKAKIYAEFLGGSFTSDAYHMIEPHPEGSGVVLCIEKALAQSGVKREDVNYINAHAASTPAGDLNEYQAILHCFGKNPELKINSTKSMTGHLLGAAGAVEAIATVKPKINSTKSMTVHLLGATGDVEHCNS
ncbi:3-oxoacyl-[acyl-carrier-protein] synthase II, chloroplastic-like [Solanum pennellii]|uniref:beta-ketoacyl-[acyl-carrier-protein] synthase I n=1 Tax=Solanum pennellii TaxID=28526 RepID=A0ABM1GC33_SOLPN|nr:3-oxoacyl-[acyl-carrier-protein] synthase II, chloroplastic-like [Solanum pennellii]